MPEVWLNGKKFAASEEAIADARRNGYDVQDGPPKGLTPVSAPDRMLETAGDAVRGAVHGVAWGLADAKLPEALGGKSIPESLGLAPYEEVSRRSPIASGAGDLGGSLAASTLIPGSGLGRGAKIVRDLGLAAAESGIRAKAEGASDEDAAKSAALGAGLSGAVGAVGAGLGRGASKLGEVLGDQADRLRARSIGVFGKQASDLRDLGFNSIRDVAEWIERVSPSTSKLGTSSGERFARAEANIAGGVGRGVDDAIRAANVPQEAVQQGFDNALNRLDIRKGSMPAAAFGAERAEQSAMGSAIDALRSDGAPVDAVGMRQIGTRFGQGARQGGKSLVPADQGEAAALDQVSQAFRGELARAVESSGGEDAIAAFRAANKDYSDQALMSQLAAKRGNTEASYSWVPDASNMTLGALATGLNAEEGQGFSDAMMGAAGAALLGATRSAGTRALSTSQGNDMLANVARYLEGKLGAANGGIAPDVLQRLAARLGTSLGTRHEETEEERARRLSGAGASGGY